MTENPANTCTQDTETLDSCFESINSNQQRNTVDFPTGNRYARQ